MLCAERREEKGGEERGESREAAPSMRQWEDLKGSTHRRSKWWRRQRAPLTSLVEDALQRVGRRRGAQPHVRPRLSTLVLRDKNTGVVECATAELAQSFGLEEVHVVAGAARLDVVDEVLLVTDENKFARVFVDEPLHVVQQPPATTLLDLDRAAF